MAWRIGLDNDLSAFTRAPRSPRNLRDKLERALVTSVIGKIQAEIGVQNPDKSYVLEIVSFCNHLRADKHVRFAL